MHKRLKRVGLGLIFMLIVGLELAVAEDAKPAAASDVDVAKKYVDAFIAGDMQLLIDHAVPQLKAVLKDVPNANSIREQTIGDGAKSSDDEVTVIYSRKVTSAGGQAFSIMVQVSPDGQLTGFRIMPAGAAPSTFLDYQTKADLRLPFDGTWTVYWGGRSLKDNYHAISVGQRFAYDILQMRADVSHAGTGEKNEDYYCFGQPIVAPGAARVAVAVDGVADNVPGKMNPAELCGNHVVLDLGNDEFLFIAHLQNGTLKVKPGDRVTPGQPLGLCGNSGNSSEPHLHIHLQTTPDLASGKGLPLQFRHYMADGKPVDRGEPTKGQQISPADAAPKS